MNILNKIVEQRKIRLIDSKKNFPKNSLERICQKPISFFKKNGEVTLIAECKKGSPSRGVMVEDFDPVKIALEYESGGADALSVLTEPDFFFGSSENLIKIRKTTKLPLLRKDFIFDSYQVKEAWAMGADAILLISAILSTDQMKELADAAQSFGLETLLEVHNKKELENATDVPATAFGINARNLKDFSIDLDAIKTMRSALPKDKIAVAESGLKSPESGREMRDAGFDAFLVGEYFVTSNSRTETVRNFKVAIK